MTGYTPLASIDLHESSHEDPAPAADQKIRDPEPEAITHDPACVACRDRQHPRRSRRGHGAVTATKRALAGSERELLRRKRALQLERQIPAMATPHQPWHVVCHHTMTARRDGISPLLAAIPAFARLFHAQAIDSMSQA